MVAKVGSVHRVMQPIFGDGSSAKKNSNFEPDFLEGETLQIEDRPQGVDNASALASASASALASASHFNLPLFANPFGLNLTFHHLHDSPRGAPRGQVTKVLLCAFYLPPRPFLVRRKGKRGEHF